VSHYKFNMLHKCAGTTAVFRRQGVFESLINLLLSPESMVMRKGLVDQFQLTGVVELAVKENNIDLLKALVDKQKTE
jgi:hypothetical protein